MTYGDIVLANSKTNWLSQCIKWFTSSKFSHSLITMPEVLSTQMCIEACAGGVDANRFDTNYLNNTDEGIEVWAINVPQATKDAALQKMLNELETSYGFLEYPWFMWRRLNKLFGRDIRAQNNWNDGGMICSQLCCAYLAACGLQSVLAGYGKGSIAPQDLQDIFKAHPDTFTLSASYRM